jgi:hypothetical protein
MAKKNRNNNFKKNALIAVLILCVTFVCLLIGLEKLQYSIHSPPHHVKDPILPPSPLLSTESFSTATPTNPRNEKRVESGYLTQNHVFDSIFIPDPQIGPPPLPILSPPSTSNCPLLPPPLENPLISNNHINLINKPYASSVAQCHLTDQGCIKNVRKEEPCNKIFTYYLPPPNSQACFDVPTN